MSRKVLALSIPAALSLLVLACAPILAFHLTFSVTLQKPEFLGLFGLAIPILLLYMLKQQQAAVSVSTLLFWSEVQRELEASAPLKKLRRRLLLLLQLFLLALFVYVCADPVMIREAPPRKTIVIVDCSTSMSTDEGLKTRLQLATEQVARMIDGLKASEEMVLIAAGARARTIQTATIQKNLLHRALRKLEVEVGNAALTDALSLAAGQLEASEAEDSGLVVVSDGAVDDLPSELSIRARTSFVKIGETSRNVGITRIESSGVESGDEQKWVLVTIQNFAARPMGLRCVIEHGKQVLALRKILLEPGKNRSYVFRLPENVEGVVAARLQSLDGKRLDAFQADDSAWTVLEQKSNLDVTVVTDSNPNLMRALRSDPRLVVTQVSEIPSLKQANQVLVIVDGKKLAPRQIANSEVPLLIVGEQQTTNGAEIKESLVSSVNRDHAVMRYVSMENVAFSQVQPIDPGFSDESLVEVAEQSVAVIRRGHVFEHVILNFDLKATNWTRDISFPIFVHNAVDFAVSQRRTQHRRVFRANEAIRFLGLGDSSLVTRPSGERTQLLRNGRFSAFLGETELGVYEILASKTKANSQDKFVVNLCSEQESNIAPRESLSVGGRKVRDTKVSRPLPLKNPVLLIGLILLIVEWILWALRIS